MRRIALLLCGFACLLAPASASAVITPTTDPAAIAGAIDTNTGAAGAFTEIPPTEDATPHATADSTPLAGFPRQSEGGDFAILTTGDASLADDANDSDGDGVGLGSGPGHGFQGAPGNAYDSSVLRLDITVPTGQTCLSFDYRFFSEEWEENVGESVNDGFVAALDADFATDENGDLSDPTNFALDEDGDVISVNTAAMTAENATGTTYDGATPVLTASTPVTTGAHSLYLAIFDQGDTDLDSAVFLDNLTLSDLNGSECGGRPDPDAPAVSITDPAAGATTAESLSFAGQAGAGATDSANVTVQVYRQGSDTPVDVLSTVRDGAGAWLAGTSGLAPGTYVARAHQTDTAGNVGVSASRTFTVAETPVEPEPTPEPTQSPEPPPPPPPPPAPELGKSFVAGKVSGTIRIKLRNGRFRTLGANEEIPLGSTVDATKGRVRLTSAAGAGKSQTADFYKGQFVVTQTKGAKPITQLALNGALACGKGKASAAAKKKKVRRLWGDGKGRFRTKGRYGAATVRGTKWLTEDRCTSTKFTVRRGRVLVRDAVKRKNKLVKQGRSYVVRKKRKQ